jgi:hypothetical protein
LVLAGFDWFLAKTCGFTGSDLFFFPSIFPLVSIQRDSILDCCQIIVATVRFTVFPTNHIGSNLTVYCIFTVNYFLVVCNILITVNYFLVVYDIIINSEALLVINFVNLKIKLVQSFECTYRGGVCVRVFI